MSTKDTEMVGIGDPKLTDEERIALAEVFVGEQVMLARKSGSGVMVGKVTSVATLLGGGLVPSRMPVLVLEQPVDLGGQVFVLALKSIRGITS